MSDLNLNILTTKYEKDLVKALYPQNSFWRKSKVGSIDRDSVPTETSYPVELFGVSGGLKSVKSAHPDPSAIDVIGMNFNAHPTFILRTNPSIVTDLDKGLLGVYGENKRAIDLEQHRMFLETRTADFFHYEFAPAKTVFSSARTFLSSSTETRPSGAPVGSPTVVKKITPEDIARIRYQAIKDDVWQEGKMVAVITPDMWEDLETDPRLIDYDKIGHVGQIEKGFRGRLFGFEIMVRSTQLIYNWSSGSPVLEAGGIKRNASFGQTTSVADANAVCGGIFWCQNEVKANYSAPKVYINVDNSVHQADIISANLYLSGGIRRQDDEKGVYALVEAIN